MSRKIFVSRCLRHLEHPNLKNACSCILDGIQELKILDEFPNKPHTLVCGKRKDFLIFILLVFLISEVSALGLTPAKAIVDFSPSLSKSMSFTIVNSEKKDLNIIIAPQGELRDF